VYIIVQLARYKNVITTQLHTYQKKGNPPFPSKEWQIALYYIRWNGKTAIHKRGSGDIWQGLWTVPESEHLTPRLRKTAILLQKGVKHVLTHRILLADFYLLSPKERPSLPEDFIWIDEKDIENYGIPRLMEKLISLA